VLIRSVHSPAASCTTRAAKGPSRRSGDAAVVLAQVVTHLHLVEQVVDAQQRKRLTAAFTKLPTMDMLSSG
jgi:hypothetical protein